MKLKEFLDRQGDLDFYEETDQKLTIMITGCFDNTIGHVNKILKNIEDMTKHKWPFVKHCQIGPHGFTLELKAPFLKP